MLDTRGKNRFLHKGLFKQQLFNSSQEMKRCLMSPSYGNDSLTQLSAFLRPQGTTGLGDMIHVVSIISWTSSIAV